MSNRRSLALLAFLFATTLCAPAIAQPEPEQRRPGGFGGAMPPTLSVTGSAEVAAEPDAAVITVGATAQAETAADAQQQVNQVMQKATEQIKETGIPAANIQTSTITLNPVYSNPRPRAADEQTEPKIAGYRASNTLQIRVDRKNAEGGIAKRLGAVIDTAVASGANQLHSIQFELEDDTEAKGKALAKAAGQARAKAQAIAGAMELRLGPVVEIVESGAVDFPPPQPFMGRAMAADAMATPVQPGQVRVSATLTLRYRLIREGEVEPAPRRAPARRQNEN